MATRQPITVDIGDGTDRVIRYSASYAKALKAKYNSLAEMLKVESEDLLPKLLLDGIKGDSPYKTEDEIRDAMDAGAQLEIVLKVLEALTGNRVAPPGEAKNVQTQTVQ